LRAIPVPDSGEDTNRGERALTTLAWHATHRVSHKIWAEKRRRRVRTEADRGEEKKYVRSGEKKAVDRSEGGKGTYGKKSCAA